MIDKLAFLKGLPEAGGVSADEERLMQLFQNRAGLKKAYADLKDELHLLRDRLKQQEGATTRVQEQLDALGDLLARPDGGYNALVFYQLRGLWKTCHQQLSGFAAELTRTQQAREMSKHEADCAAARACRLREIDERLTGAALRAEEQRRRLTAAGNALQKLTAFWHYFERRRRQKSLEDLRQAVAAADDEMGALQADRGAASEEPPAAFPGISLSARRNINLAIIGYAELLCEQVDSHGLAAKAKESVARRVHEMQFGSRSDCEGYMQRVQKALAAATNQKQLTAAIKVRLERTRATCDYRNGADTVPTADSLARAPGWNVLAEDYWDLYTLLLR